MTYADLKVLLTSMPFYDRLKIYKCMHVYTSNFEKDTHHSSCILLQKARTEHSAHVIYHSELSHKRHYLQKPYRISPNYHTYPYKNPILNLQITARVL